MREQTDTTPPRDDNICVGWLLDDAHAFLDGEAQHRQYSIVVVETAPPPRPSRVGAARKPKLVDGASVDSVSKASRPAVYDGEWRVLRCHLSTAIAGGTLELLVAREQIVDAAP